MIRIGQLRSPGFDTTVGITPLAIDEGSSSIPLDRHRLQSVLDRRCVEEGVATSWDARVVTMTASTNSDLMREARSGGRFARPVLLAAEIQTGGRGRLGRAWHSTPGASLTVSYALCVARRLAELEGISLVCGLAVRDALARHGVLAALKWPNDVLVDGRKLAGILVEAHAPAAAAAAAAAAATIVIVGVGINVLPQSAEAARRETNALAPIDLQSAGCSLHDRNILAAELALAIERRLARFATTGFAAFASEWNAIDAFRDRRVFLRAALGTSPGETVAGLERGVDASGALSIEVDGELQRFIAGDLSLRAADTP